jgi:hypothetical protein
MKGDKIKHNWKQVLLTGVGSCCKQIGGKFSHCCTIWLAQANLHMLKCLWVACWEKLVYSIGKDDRGSALMGMDCALGVTVVRTSTKDEGSWMGLHPLYGTNLKCSEVYGDEKLSMGDVGYS